MEATAMVVCLITASVPLLLQEGRELLFHFNFVVRYVSNLYWRIIVVIYGKGVI